MAYLMIEYYRLIYVNLKLRKPFSEGTENDTIIQTKMSKFGRCQIGSEVFGSLISLQHVKSSYILSKFINKDRSVDCYPEQVQYYFTHTVNLLNRKSDDPAKHFLAYVR